MFQQNNIRSDPYNWPFPKRQDTMFLSTIRQLFQPDGSDIPEKKMKKVPSGPNTLKCSDIDGTLPMIKPYKFTNKIDFINKLDDIKGSSSQHRWYPQKKDLQLYNEDIKGSKPQIFKFQTTRKMSNPLQPIYKLPFVQYIQYQIPKFIKDPNDVSVTQFYQDIQGAKPKIKSRVRYAFRIKEQIQGTSPKKPKYRNINYDSLNVKDINSIGNQFLSTKRFTNPLDPIYEYPDQTNQLIKFGQVEGSKPKRRHPQIVNKFQDFTLRNSDIEGSFVGTVPSKFLMTNTRKDFINTNNTMDIFGAQSSTLKKGLTTIRNINPLIPKYQWLGRSQVQGGIPNTHQKFDKYFKK